MLRYNPTYQQRADRLAQEENIWAFAHYVGHYHGSVGSLSPLSAPQDWLVFRPMHDDTILRTEGFPFVILINDQHEEMTNELPYNFEIINTSSRSDTLSQARRLFREYERKVQHNDFANDQERADITALVNAAHGTYPIPRTDIYIYLQAAHRLHRRLLVLPYPDGKRLHLINEQGHTLNTQEYYLQLQ